ncbi:hypothetical protein ASD11_11240 [Aeromicrobium sp. Root495]|uniref:serine/threonine-protein kinase n=1 Tax=Aeromicrobium sp. Root495 TaxID=1736550 RepID=UPI0006F79CDE|nr:serine/threonine-protein kinase [Aeromicrobium sp. Root495]KQY60064.1 hypothetical protein ASD11_11240 [Aeromicrobium sp. Root495]
MVDLGIPGLEDAELIGRGGFGQVYKARQPALNRTVAVKVLRVAEVTDEELRLFERECAAVGSLDWCPDIVSVFAAGTTPDGDPYMVMEFAPGGTLRDRMRSTGHIDETQARDVALHIGTALAHAHDAGLLHRDVKPANILYSRNGNPILADFGIAKVTARTGATSTAAMSGTIAYLAPEVLLDSQASPASDIFSLGATLLEALTGATPFRSSSSDTAATIMRRAFSHEDVDLTGVPVSTDLAAILGRCLAVDPARRYSSAHELLHDLATGAGTVPTPDEPTVIRTPRPSAAPVDLPDDSTQIRRRPAAGAPPLPPGSAPLEEAATSEARRRSTVLAVAATSLVLAATLVAGVVWAVSRSGSDDQQPVAADAKKSGAAKPSASVNPEAAPQAPTFGRRPAGLPSTVSIASAPPEEHVQGIVVDRENKFIYWSFKDWLYKTNFSGDVVASVTGLGGHLGDLTLDAESGKIYGSLTRKDINGFFLAVIDGKDLTGLGQRADETDGVSMVYMPDVTNDYLEDVNGDGTFDGDVAETPDHRYGTSGIDGIALGPALDGSDEEMVTVAYGIFENEARSDNDYQVLLQFTPATLAEYAQPVSSSPASDGPESPAGKYFVYTGNTRYGVQNLAFDPWLDRYLLAVYEGPKPSFPNYTLFSIPARTPATTQKLRGLGGETGSVVKLAPDGLRDGGTGVRGWRFDAALGLESLGGGYFYTATGETAEGAATLTLRRWAFDAQDPFTGKR